MTNIDVSEAGFTTDPATTQTLVDVADAGLRTAPVDGAGATVYVDVADAGLSIGGNVSTIPFWRINQGTQEWEPLTGEVFMLRAGKWVLL